MAVLFNPVAQAKFVHTVSAGYVTGAIFVLAISACYLLRGRHVELAKRSMTVAASFGLASALSVVVLGDESGYTADREPEDEDRRHRGDVGDRAGAGAASPLFGIPDQRGTHDPLRDQGPLGARPDRHALARQAGSRHRRAGRRRPKTRIRNGLDRLRRAADSCARDRSDAGARATLDAHAGRSRLCAAAQALSARHRSNATDAQIAQAAWDTVPDVPVLFWSFRLMVGARLLLHRAVRASRSICRATRELDRYRAGSCSVALLSLPLPWIAAELGWIVAEYGRQPWVDRRRAADLPRPSRACRRGNVLVSLIGFVVFYTALAVVDVYLMVKYDPARPGRDARAIAAAPPRGAERRAQEATMPCSTTKSCASSGGRCSASC